MDIVIISYIFIVLYAVIGALLAGVLINREFYLYKKSGLWFAIKDIFFCLGTGVVWPMALVMIIRSTNENTNLYKLK